MPSFPYGTVQEFIDYAKAHPGKVNIGHTLGSPPQVLAEMFKKASGAPFNTVSYRQRPQLTPISWAAGFTRSSAAARG